MDYSLPGSSVHGDSLREEYCSGLSCPHPGIIPRSLALQTDSLLTEPPGKPQVHGAWWAAVRGVAQSRTRLKRLSSSSIKLKTVF